MGKFHLLKNPSSWRRISIANWNAPNDPTVYGFFEIDVTNALAFIEKINKTSPIKITMTHVVAKAAALILARHPDLNGIIRWKQIYLRDTVDIFLQVAIEAADENSKPDLSGCKVECCDKKTLVEIATDVSVKSNKIRKNEDELFKKTLSFMNKIPPWLLSFVVRLSSFLIYNLGVNIPSLGLREDPFGSCMVTSVGMWNIPPGFAPLVPVSRVPLIICAGEVKDKPWVVDGEIKIRPIQNLTVTFDHRFIDGLTGSKMARFFRELMTDPEKFMS